MGDVGDPVGGEGVVQELEVLVDGGCDGVGGSGLFVLGGTVAGTVFRYGVNIWYGVTSTIFNVYSVCFIQRIFLETVTDTIWINTVTIPAATGNAVIPIPARSIPNPVNFQRRNQQLEKQ